MSKSEIKSVKLCPEGIKKQKDGTMVVMFIKSEEHVLVIDDPSLLEYIDLLKSKTIKCQIPILCEDYDDIDVCSLLIHYFKQIIKEKNK